jgi:subtilisin family serine protease
MPVLILTIPNSPAGRIAIEHLRVRGDQLGCYEMRAFADRFEERTRALLNRLPRTFHEVSVYDGTELTTALRVVRFHNDVSGDSSVRGLVEGAEPNTRLRLATSLGLPFKLGGHHQQYLQQMRVPAAHGAGILGAGVRVAVIDSGVDSGWGFLSDFFDLYHMGSWHPGTAKQVDNDGHGTAMATLIQEVAPDADLAAVRIVDQADPTVLSLLAGLVLAVLEYRADVVSMSLGFEHFGATCGICGATAEARSVALHALLEGLLGQAIAGAANYRPPIYVAATGNQQRSTSFDYPAAYDRVLAVGSVDSSGTRSTFSNWGTSHSTYVMAPGGSDVYPTEDVGSGSNIACFGTSVSAAYVSGLCALVWSDPAHAASDRDAVIQEVLRRCHGQHGLEYGSGTVAF